LGVCPNAYLFVSAPRAFWFNNLGYHAIRSTEGLIGDFPQKLHMLLEIPGDFTLAFLLLFAGLLFPRSQAPRRSLALAVSLCVVCLLPTPTFIQYLCVAVPFLIVTVVCGATEAIELLGSEQAKRSTAAFYSVLIVIAVSCSLLNDQYRQYFNGRAGMHLSSWQWQTASQVSRAIENLAGNNGPVLTSWPGYMIETSAPVFPGTENQFALGCADALTPEQRRVYRVISQQEIYNAISNHQAKIVAVGDESTPPGMTPAPDYRTVLLKAGYTLEQSIGGVSVWRMFLP